MFISTNYLVDNYGIDEKIARFFVDREPPEDNLYWHEKLLYLRPAPGYLFIPLIVDLLHRLGIERQQLLSEEFVSTMEQIGHFSALEEVKKISKEEAIQKSAQFVKDKSRNNNWLNHVNDYFAGVENNVLKSLATPFKSLHRGDVFLYSLSTLQFPDALTGKIAEQWFALISILLLLDDADDLESDSETGDENAFLECGLDPKGIERILELVRENFKKMASLNSQMYHGLDRQFIELKERPDINKLLNQVT